MPYVIYGMAQNGDAFDSHAEGESRVDVGVNTTACENVWMDHSTTKNLKPAGTAAYAATRAVASNAFDGDLTARFNERKVVATEPDA